MLSTKWIFNCEAEFKQQAKKDFMPTFKKAQWRAPVEALTKVEISKKGEYTMLIIESNFEKQNKILTMAGHKKVKKV